MAVDFGRDVSCTTSIKTGRYVTGARLVAEAAFRRLTTPRGMLRGGEEEANYGMDLSAEVGKTQREDRSLPGRITNELKKDERIESVTVDVVRTEEAKRVTLKVRIVAQTAAGPFTLRVSATTLTVELLEIKADD